MRFAVGYQQTDPQRSPFVEPGESPSRELHRGAEPPQCWAVPPGSRNGIEKRPHGSRNGDTGCRLRSGSIGHRLRAGRHADLLGNPGGIPSDIRDASRGGIRVRRDSIRAAVLRTSRHRRRLRPRPPSRGNTNIRAPKPTRCACWPSGRSGEESSPTARRPPRSSRGTCKPNARGCMAANPA